MNKHLRFQQLLKTGLYIILVSALLLPAQLVNAQSEPPAGPVYIVQSGDTFWTVAVRFGVSLDELIAANSAINPELLKPGDRLVIPGLEGVNGVLTTEAIAFGESLRSLSRQLQIPADTLAHLNQLTSPVELYAGVNLILPVSEETKPLSRRAMLEPGQSLLEFSVIQGFDPWSLVVMNDLDGSWAALPGDVLHMTGDPEEGPAALPEQITALKVESLPFIQGKTSVIRINSTENLTLGGDWLSKPLHFFRESEGNDFIALQGIHAMQEPGIYPLMLSGTLPNGVEFKFEQWVRVKSGDYYQGADLVVDESGLDPAITQPEDAQWFGLASPTTPEQQWEGPFNFPTLSIYIGQYTSRFGERRTYNQSSKLYFHTGLDIPGQVGNEVYAAAPGRVVFAGPLAVRGNALMIDHGWGVYSAYMHLSEFRVSEGDRVESGELIALVGNTGLRTTGSHLHWEILVGGVQVNPLDWFEQGYP